MWFDRESNTGTSYDCLNCIQSDALSTDWDNPPYQKDYPQNPSRTTVRGPLHHQKHKKSLSASRSWLIGFGRYSVVNTAICYSEYGPCLESITMFYNKLPDDKFDITKTLVENSNNEVKENGSIHHLPNHFNKYTYYYPFIDKILLL